MGRCFIRVYEADIGIERRFFLNPKEFETVIVAGKNLSGLKREIWKYRELFFFLTWRDILVKYKQTILGIAWSVIRPLLTMIISVIVFGKIAKLPSDNIAYPILVFTGTIPWTFFANGLQDSGNSLVASSNMLTKVYFPRIIIPVSVILTSIIDLFISSVILFVLMFYYGFIPSFNIVFLPIFIIQLFLLTLGPSLLISSLNVKYRDIRYILPFIVQFGLFISPVGYSSSNINGVARIIYSLNPLTGIIDGFRWAILGTYNSYTLFSILISVAATVLFLVAGFIYFRKTERFFADLI